MPSPIRILSWVIVLLVGGLVLGGGRGARAQRITAVVDSAGSVIDYTGSAPMHDWTGTSRDVAGRFVLSPKHPDSSRAVIWVPVASFDSGNDLRDRKMRNVTEADQYPIVRFRATKIRPLRWGRTQDGRGGQWRATGRLTFHGRTHPIDVPVKVQVDDDSVYAQARFAISLTRFEVERPSLLWASIGDTIRIDARIVGVRTSASPASEGAAGPPTRQSGQSEGSTPSGLPGRLGRGWALSPPN